jgi:hypothetical protein
MNINQRDGDSVSILPKKMAVKLITQSISSVMDQMPVKLITRCNYAHQCMKTSNPNNLASVEQGIFLLVAGFFRLPKDLPKAVWRYPMSYIGFHMYALQVWIN